MEDATVAPLGSQDAGKGGQGDPTLLDASSGDTSTEAAVSCAPLVYAPPLVITKGGTYRGNWESTNRDTPAILVSTTEEVTIEGAQLRGSGELISTSVAGARLTVRQTRGVAVNPNIAGRAKGTFLHVGDVAQLTLENCDIEGSDYGVVVDKFLGDKSSKASIVIRYNRMKNIDSRFSDGKGGYNSNQELNVGREFSHAVMLAHIFGVGGIEIAWNEFINEPYQSSVDDVVNMYQASGTAQSPALIHDNYLRGAYGSDPTINYYTGGGIIADGSSDDTPDTSPGHIKIYDNQVVNNANYGVQIGAGHDIEVYGNRTVSTGRLPNGEWMASTFGNGVIVWNGYSQSTSYFNDFAHDNISGWLREQGEGDPKVRVAPPIRVDYYMPACEGGWGTPESKCTNNSSLSGDITAATEQAEWDFWQAKLKKANVSLGAPACPSP